MSYLVLSSVPSSTTGAFRSHSRTANCGAQNERRVSSLHSSTTEQDTAGNLSQYPPPAAAFYEALLATAAATTSPQPSACFENLNVGATPASLYAAAALACAPVNASDNYVTQRLRNATAICPHRAATRDSQHTAIPPARAVSNAFCVSASPARYTTRVYPIGEGQKSSHDKSHYRGGDRPPHSLTDTVGVVVEKAGETKREQNDVPTTTQWLGSFKRPTNSSRSSENAGSCAPQNVSTPEPQKFFAANEYSSGSSLSIEAPQQIPFSESLHVEGPAAVRADPQWWDQTPPQPQNASDELGIAQPASQRRTANLPIQKANAPGGAIRANQGSSAASGGRLSIELQHQTRTSKNCASPGRNSSIQSHASRVVLPRKSRSRASFSACCWETGRYPYPDACTPRTVSAKTSACIEVGCDAGPREACSLRNLQCVSPPHFPGMPSMRCPDGVTGSKVESACCDVLNLCTFTAFTKCTPDLSREREPLQTAGGRAKDWLAVARGRDSAASFCRITLEEAAGDGLCNPHHELQSLADILRGEEGSPAFVPRVTLTSELRGVEDFGEAPSSLGFHWHDGSLLRSDARSSPAPAAIAGGCAAPCNSSCVPTNVPNCRSLLATPTCSRQAANFSRKPQACLAEVATSTEARARTNLSSEAAPSFLSDGHGSGSFLSSTAAVSENSMVAPPADTSVDRHNSCLPPGLPDGRVFDVELVSEREEYTAPASDRVDSSLNRFQDTPARMCRHRVLLDTCAATSLHTASVETEISIEEVTSSNRASRIVSSSTEGLEGSDVCLSTPSPPEQCPLLTIVDPVRSALHSEPSARKRLSELRPQLGAAPSTLSASAEVDSISNTWHTENSGTVYPLPSDSASVHSCSTTRPPFTKSPWTQIAGAAAHSEATRKNHVGMMDIVEEETLTEENGGFSADVSTTPSVCGSGSCSTSPLTPPQCSPATAMPAGTTAATPTNCASEPLPQEPRPPFVHHSNFSLPPPTLSRIQSGVSGERATPLGAVGAGSIYNGITGEVDHLKTSNATGSHSLLSISSGNGNSPPTLCNESAVDCTTTCTAGKHDGGSEKASPTRLLLVCPTSGPRRLPTAPTEAERRPHTRSNLNCLQFPVFPPTSSADSPQSEHTGLQLSEYAAALANSCCRTASESVPTPTTAGHSSQSPVAFSPLSSEGDITSAHGSSSVHLAACSSRQQDFFSLTSNDESRETPSSVSGCALPSTVAAPLQLFELFSGKDRNTGLFESAASHVTCSLSSTETSSSRASHGVAVRQCSIPPISTTAPTASTVEEPDRTVKPAPLSLDKCIPNAAGIISKTELLLTAPQEPVDAAVSGQTNAAAAGKSTNVPVAADECAENVYGVEHPPPVLHTSAPDAPAAPQAAEDSAASAESLKCLPHETELETFRYVLAGSEADMPQCNQYSETLLQQQLAASLLSKDLAQNYQQWWFSNCRTSPCPQQQSDARALQASGQAEYPGGDAAATFGCSGRPYGDGVAAQKEQLIRKYAHHCETSEAVVGRLPLTASAGKSGPYTAADEELIEYEEHWEGAHGSAFEMGDAGPTAVPVRTRKGFRKPLPLPQEMLACPGEPGESEKGNEPVLQYDISSREWRVFWVEGRLARYKVFQAKKFGKERAQQLAEEWYQRARTVCA